MIKKTITILIPCFNEMENIPVIYDSINKEIKKYPEIKFQILFVDNCSTDTTQQIIRTLAKKDKNISAIFNLKNNGYIRSTHHALIQTDSDAVILMAADLQDPPSLIGEFIENWNSGFKIVVGVKNKSREFFLMYLLRSFYYKLLKSISDKKQIEHFTGFGLYDKIIIDHLRKVDDQMIYLRGFFTDLGYEIGIVKYTQPIREKGKSKMNLVVLFDFAMVGMTSNSKVPIRLATYSGILISIISFCISLATLAKKLLSWDTFELGVAPILIGVFFLGGLHLAFIGIIGEYIGAIHSQLFKRPRVIEKERINFPIKQNTKTKGFEIS